MSRAWNGGTAAWIADAPSGGAAEIRIVAAMAKSLPSIATIATIAHVTARREYARRFGIDPDDYVLGVCAREDWKRYERDLERLGGRVWVLLSHWLPDEKAFFLEQLDQRGTRLDARQFGHAAVYLYELGPR